MKVRIGWPLGTLAAFVVGYVGAVVVAPSSRVLIPDETDAAESARDVAVPMPLALQDGGTDTALTSENGPRAGVPGTPPPLRGAREEVASARSVDRTLVSDAERDRTRATVDRWYQRLDAALPAVNR